METALLTPEEIALLLPEFKQRLGVPVEDTDGDAALGINIADGYEYAAAWCNNLFRDDFGVLKLPGPIKKGIIMMIQIDESVLGREGVSSESVPGMSQSFVTSTNERVRYADVFGLWRKYKRMRFTAVSSSYEYERP